MIAACPKCEARYRIERDKLKSEGVRLRCSKCQVIFRVRPPAGEPEEVAAVAAPVAVDPPRPRMSAPVEHAVAPAREPSAPQAQSQSPAPQPPVPEVQSSPAGDGSAPPAAPAADAPLVLVGTPDAELGKQLESALTGWGLRSAVVGDGVELMLEIQRQMPQAVLLGATLPRMFGFQVCELVKRNESLRSIGMVLLGSIHHKDRYRRPPEEIYGADAYVEEPDLPEALWPELQRMGLAAGVPAPSQEPEVAAPPVEAPAPAPEAASPAPALPHVEAPEPSAADDPLREARDQAERLARIIVSDIVLYNEEKFSAAIAAGNVVEAMAGDLDEGRALFEDRVDDRLRSEGDFLARELVRVAQARGAS